jgi:hypothetical protein
LAAGLAAISEAFIYQGPATAERKCLGVFHRRLIFMIFDIITVIILFQATKVLSRLVEQRRGDVLDYVARQQSTLA